MKKIAILTTLFLINFSFLYAQPVNVEFQTLNVLHFDGDDDYVETPGLLGKNPNISLAAWAKVNSDQRGEIISLGDHVAIRLNDGQSQKGFFRASNGWLATGIDSTLTPGWHFFTYTNYDSTGTGVRIQKFYIDGNEVARTSESSEIDYSGLGSNTRIGIHGTNNTYADFNGDLDDISVWNVGLDSLEVLTLFNNGKPLDSQSDEGDYTSSSKLVAYWKFSEGTGTTLSDATANEYNGTITNATWKIKTPIVATMKEDQPITVDLSIIDPNLKLFTFVAVSDTNAVSVSVSSSMLTFTPKVDWYGLANIKVYASLFPSFKDSLEIELTVTPVSDMVSIQDLTIDEDKAGDITLTSTFDGASTFTAISDNNAVSVSVSSSTLTLTPKANWNGVATIKAYASDGSSKDSTSFKITVTALNDSPEAFEWVSSPSDTIYITQSNLADTYTLEWDASIDIDGDVINYLIYAKIGLYPIEEVEEITDTAFELVYEEILEQVFEGSPVNGATVRLNVRATDGIDTVDVTGDNIVLYVNRYDYLSVESEGIPTEFALHENYPNPFNPSTTLRFDLPEVSNITLTIFNMLGQKIRTYDMQSAAAGYHTLKWNATNDYGDPVGAGIYLYQLQSKDFVKTRKMVLMK